MADRIITISAKNLGQLSLPDFCERCFWVKLKAKGNIPFQIFPGIFSSIDSYSKRMIHSWFDRHGSSPVWLSGIGEIVKYEEPPHYSRFIYSDKESGIVLRGNPDALFIKKDMSYVIADYKTAKYTQAQDNLLPMYETQLNSYALIGQNQGMSVSQLALIYTEPVTAEEIVNSDDHHYDDGFSLKFSSHIHPIDLNTESIKPLLKQTKAIHDKKKPPSGKRGCKDCMRLEFLVDLINGR